MKHIISSLVLASAVAAVTGAAQAETASVTLQAGGDPVEALGIRLDAPQGRGSLSFSGVLQGALYAANITTTVVSPATLTETADKLIVNAPVQSLTGTLDSATGDFAVGSYRTLGGALMTASALLPNGRKNIASTGGSLSITDIQVDLLAQDIYATLTGANGVGVQNNVLVWNFGDRWDRTLSEGEAGHVIENWLPELTITADAFDLFAQSLGLTAFGKTFIGDVTSYGNMTTHLSVPSNVSWGPDPYIPPIPEPSSYTLMGLGLVGLAFAPRRARRA